MLRHTSTPKQRSLPTSALCFLKIPRLCKSTCRVLELL
ncbi:hypothetical protein FOIG_16924 [Fusarium odoratissimum NRRL 54006]|uniref:Uncharacterized protein n=1 Tax=Fusarium odoratissimum (strain NRRL 54006) TaxID=1089451 RepID=X0ILT9_FUSO5|nr:uncharacterized protein FOIG_16924 [Fusarium odoratissimum NRRL 54006]EXL89792.1 hypothetical protein FOIG_16924 [Fusarium odoratissimum NRRL 54006]